MNIEHYERCMQIAADKAEELTERHCEEAGIQCWVETSEDSFSFTPPAQTIFDNYYDHLMIEMEAGEHT